MVKIVLTACVLMLAVAASFGQAPNSLLLQIKNSKPDTNRVKLQLALSGYYRGKKYRTPAQLDSALTLDKNALQLARSLHNMEWEQNVLWHIAQTYFAKNDTTNASASFALSRNLYYKNSEYLSEAHTWSAEANLYPSIDKQAIAHKLTCYNNALIILKRLNRLPEVADVLKNIAIINIGIGDVSPAEKELLQVIELYKKTGYKKLHYAYDLLGRVYSMNGNPGKEIFYRLEAIRSMEATGDSSLASEYYANLSGVYTIIGKRDEGLTWLRKAIAAKKGYDIGMYTDMINDLAALNRTEEALDTINALAKKPFPADFESKITLFKSIGFCYSKLHQDAKAEEYYLKMMAVDLSGMKRQNIFSYVNLYLTVNDAIAWFYIHSHQTAKARKYLDSMMAVYKSSRVTIHPVFRMNTYKGLYAVEYESHHYREAIHYLQTLNKLYDSVFNADKNRQIEEFKIKYETDKREKDIKLLESHDLAQTATVQKARLQRNITFAGIAMVMIIAGLAYSGYRNKQQNNVVLKAQQVEINSQNNVLQSLLTEKDWLLKEVHHRVKNNLQIVMSLLSSQSAYLENSAAIEAIRESQNRVQAISLIHQKLYKTSNVASINMQAYVADLMGYLADSFDTRPRNIRIEQLVEPFNLDIAQAVPLGLILNESVTNAIKYAFDDKGGQIIIAIQLIGTENLLLTIEDNGKGMKGDFDLKTASSLGMEMMKALSKQLGGEFKIKNNPGVNISVEFEIAKVSHKVSAENMKNHLPVY